ncbi:phospholipid-transporting ATPase VD-like [Brienomyrus brachyistius]|uniref:phospholipid-transporting ATPase VD-like n=1 Tax=Brienomyrus brachyistius TaxID=42636 RepID=UPI0020B30868|nr:phospholipid-transporting ATPase VD-like [Brienomyrus brachyistius]
MESLRWVQHRCRRLLFPESGLSWYSPADSPPQKNRTTSGDSPAYKPAGKRRMVIARHGPYQDEYCSISKGYQGNRIRTTKYTILSFIPMNLFEQFHRIANLYFLFLVLLNWVPVVEAFQKEITMIPLVVVLGIIAFKDALEDFRRYRFDKVINNNITKVYCGKQRRYVDKCWKDVCVGDFVQLACNEIIPADMVLLQSSDPDGVCHIETANLDGETNLKQRQVVRGLAKQGSDVIPENFDSRIECESPNNDLNRFRGVLENPNKLRVGLCNDNLLLRSCTVRNTETIIGIVVYAGHETKAMKNNSGPRYKRSKLERRLNTDVLWSVVLLLVMCLTAAIGHGLWLSSLKNPAFIIPDGISPVLAGFYLFWTMIIVLQVLIPISLYVSIEIVKLGQIYFIQNDVDFHSGRLASGVQCRALNITEDLGQIQYVFSDKTGTLTENKMVFCRCSIAGVDYPHEDNARRLELYRDQDCDDDDDDDAGRPTTKVKSRSSLRSLSCRSLNCNHSSVSLHTLTGCEMEPDLQTEPLDGGAPRQTAFSSHMEKDVIPDPQLLHKLAQLPSPSLPLLYSTGDSSQEIPYIVDFFLAMALCNTVVVSSPGLLLPNLTLEVPRNPIRSLEDLKLLFPRFGVPRFAALSSPGGNGLQEAESPSNFTQRLLFRMKGSASSFALPKVDVGEGEDSPVRAPSPAQVELGALVSEAAEAEPWLEVESGGDGGPDQDEAEELMYEAESPDEAALVHAARAYRCTLRARTSEKLVVDLPGLGHLTVPLLHVLPFDSLRKRMSVVVRHPLTSQVVVYTKGADSAIMDLITTPKDDRQAADRLRHIRERTQLHLDDYARQGLRTLCIATKVLEEEDYAMWLKRHSYAETSIENREELLQASTSELETDLTLLGATGIVDQLQEQVPETIEALQAAGIRVWVLTGDKQETAISIACSCKLLRATDKLLTANCANKEACEVLLADLLKTVEDGRGAISGFTLVIDGWTLELVLRGGLEDSFLKLAGCCRAVICCRSTPLQKSQVVQLVRDKLGVVTLAVGDGANDVSMIQMADVGIGISGQEGMQAVMSSDFAISRFKHLRKLLLVHGHWCYTRLANMILYFFYKNVAYVNLLFWYQFFCGFSGSTMTNYWVLILFNLLFTSAPPLLYGILDKDVSADTLLQLPVLYQAGQDSLTYLPSTFWYTILDALYQSLACFFVPYFAYADSDISVFSLGTPINTSALLIILLHQVIESRTLTWMHGAVLLGSAFLYFVFILVFSSTCVTCNSPSNPLGIGVRHVSDPLFYCVCLLTTVLALLPRILYRSISNSICPPDLVKAAQMDRLNPDERKRSIQLWRASQLAALESQSGGGGPLLINAEDEAYRQGVGATGSAVS